MDYDRVKCLQIFFCIEYKTNIKKLILKQNSHDTCHLRFYVYLIYYVIFLNIIKILLAIQIFIDRFKYRGTNNCS